MPFACLFVGMIVESSGYKCRNKRKGDEKGIGTEGAEESTMKLHRRIYNRKEQRGATDRLEPVSEKVEVGVDEEVKQV